MRTVIRTYLTRREAETFARRVERCAKVTDARVVYSRRYDWFNVYVSLPSENPTP